MVKKNIYGENKHKENHSDRKEVDNEVDGQNRSCGEECGFHGVLLIVNSLIADGVDQPKKCTRH